MGATFPGRFGCAAAYFLASMLLGATAQAGVLGGTNDRLGARVVAYAEQQIGHQVGNGECTELADQALANSGARGADSYGDITPDGDYVWGTKVALADAQPGDIVQFHNFHIRKFISDAGGQSWWVEARDHHTAIVEANLGNTLVLLEQNVDPEGQVVQRSRVPVVSMTYSAGGWSRTSITVDGTISVYRPQRAG